MDSETRILDEEFNSLNTARKICVYRLSIREEGEGKDTFEYEDNEDRPLYESELKDHGKSNAVLTIESFIF